MPKGKKIVNACIKQDLDLFFDKYLKNLYQEIRDIYLADSRPWVIGYSGGKDSTATLQVVWKALEAIPIKQLTKKVYIITSDTFVETPVLVGYINRTLALINSSAKKQKLPFEAHKVTPKLDDTFWVNMIGRGYPAPYSKFRWCTDRLKIKPASQFITDKIAAYGEVIVVLGARFSESSSRAAQMKKRKKVGNRLTRHTTLPNAWVMTPIEEWHTEEVWEYLLSESSPWGNDNEELLSMYKNAQDGDCPLIIDKTAPSCGNSRFGCWTCTVVAKDTSMESMIKSGEKWMKPLLEFRDWLAKTQDPAGKKDIRDVRRRSGKVQFQEIDGHKKVIWGPYLLAFRQEILKRLLQAQTLIQSTGPNPAECLISEDELLKIRQLWLFDECDWQDTLPQIYKQTTGKKLNTPKDDWSGMGREESEILQDICSQHNIPTNLLTELFDAERRQYGMSKRSEIYSDIDAILRKDWVSKDEVLANLSAANKTN